MGNLEQLARYESANSAVAFRESVYGPEDRPQLLRDLIGLANAQVEGPRYIFLGVRHAADDRRIIGIADAQIRDLHEACASLISQYIEPSLLIRVEEVTIDGATVPVLVLPDCSDPPYLLKKNASDAMRVGGGWLRQGDSFRRLRRADLQRSFERKLLAKSAGAELRVGFEGKTPMSSICLPVMPIDQLPSEHARGKYEKLLAARKVSRNARDQVGSRIERLVHAQVFGEDKPYSAASTATLVRRVQPADTECEAADRHYEHEIRAHKINLLVENIGSSSFERGTLVLDIPNMDGVEIPPAIPVQPGCPAADAGAYPTIEAGPRCVRVQAALASVSAGAKIVAFREPLRVCLRERAAGTTLPIEFTVYGRGLRKPVSGVLRVEVVAR